MFYCEFYKISKNTFFTQHLRATASAGFTTGLLWKHELNLRINYWSRFVKKVFLENLQISQEKNFVEVSF